MSSLFEILKRSGYDPARETKNPRRELTDPVNIADVMKLFITQTEKERNENKSRWLKLYRILIAECFYNAEKITIEDLQNTLQCLRKGNIILVRCNEAPLRSHLNYHTQYILTEIQKTNNQITNIIFC